MSSVAVADTIDSYLQQRDWRVNANANQGYSVGGLILNTAGKMIANYWLDHVYPPDIGQAHREGDVHIQDLDMLGGYCAGWSLRTLLHEGFNGPLLFLFQLPQTWLSRRGTSSSARAVTKNCYAKNRRNPYAPSSKPAAS